MVNKERYFQALKANNGNLNEMDLGETIGLDEPETRRILTQLLAEYRIFFVPHGACEYSTSKSEGRMDNRKHL